MHRAAVWHHNGMTPQRCMTSQRSQRYDTTTISTVCITLNGMYDTAVWHHNGLNGTPDANSPNEAMSHNGRTITDIKSKANIFINHYARVSKLKMSQFDHEINQ